VTGKGESGIGRKPVIPGSISLQRNGCWGLRIDGFEGVDAAGEGLNEGLEGGDFGFEGVDALGGG
jgi:hypothetical protein